MTLSKQGGRVRSSYQHPRLRAIQSSPSKKDLRGHGKKRQAFEAVTLPQDLNPQNRDRPRRGKVAGSVYRRPKTQKEGENTPQQVHLHLRLESEKKPTANGGADEPMENNDLGGRLDVASMSWPTTKCY